MVSFKRLCVISVLFFMGKFFASVSVLHLVDSDDRIKKVRIMFRNGTVQDYYGGHKGGFSHIAFFNEPVKEAYMLFFYMVCGQQEDSDGKMLEMVCCYAAVSCKDIRPWHDYEIKLEPPFFHLIEMKESFERRNFDYLQAQRQKRREHVQALAKRAKLEHAKYEEWAETLQERMLRREREGESLEVDDEMHGIFLPDSSPEEELALVRSALSFKQKRRIEKSLQKRWLH